MIFVWRHFHASCYAFWTTYHTDFEFSLSFSLIVYFFFGRWFLGGILVSRVGEGEEVCCLLLCKYFGDTRSILRNIVSSYSAVSRSKWDLRRWAGLLLTKAREILCFDLWVFSWRQAERVFRRLSEADLWTFVIYAFDSL